MAAAEAADVADLLLLEVAFEGVVQLVLGAGAEAGAAVAEEDFLAFLDSQGLGRDDRNVPEIIECVYDSAKCHKDPDAWLERCWRGPRAIGSGESGFCVSPPSSLP